MDVLQKLKRMSERASKESFALRFYKTGDAAMEQSDSPKRFKEVEWFSHKTY